MPDGGFTKFPAEIAVDRIAAVRLREDQTGEAAVEDDPQALQIHLSVHGDALSNWCLQKLGR